MVSLAADVHRHHCAKAVARRILAASKQQLAQRAGVLEEPIELVHVGHALFSLLCYGKLAGYWRGNPRIRSAAALNSTITESSLHEMMASAAVSRIARAASLRVRRLLRAARVSEPAVRVR